MTVKNPSMYYAEYRFFKKFKIIWYFKLPTKTTHYLAYIIKFVYELKLKKNFLHHQRIKHKYILCLHDIKVMSINYISWLYYHSMKYFKVLINNDRYCYYTIPAYNADYNTKHNNIYYYWFTQSSIAYCWLVTTYSLWIYYIIL